MICLASAGVTGFAVVIADHVRRAAVHRRPGPLGQVPGDDAAGFEVPGAAPGHLQVIDPGQLRVLLTGAVGGADER
jgi:hypothetical protein